MNPAALIFSDVFHDRRDPCSVRTHGLEVRNTRAEEAAVHGTHVAPIHLRSSASGDLHEPSAQDAMQLRSTEGVPSSRDARRSGRRTEPSSRSSTHTPLQAWAELLRIEQEAEECRW